MTSINLDENLAELQNPTRTEGQMNTPDAPELDVQAANIPAQMDITNPNDVISIIGLGAEVTMSLENMVVHDYHASKTTILGGSEIPEQDGADQE